MKEHHMTCVGNPLPGEKDLFMLASKAGIPNGQAKEIIHHVGKVVRTDLREWL